MFTFGRALEGGTGRTAWSGPAGRSPLWLHDHLPVCIEVFSSFSEVEAKWRKAQADCACYGFQTFDWLSTCQGTVGIAEGVEPRIVHVAGANGNTLMLLPLGIRRRHGLSFLNFLGGDTTDYNAPIVDAEFAAGLDSAASNRLLGCVLEQLPRVDVIAFERMPSEIDGVPNPLAILPGAKHVSNAYAATLGGTFKDFKKRRSPKFFSTGERKWRRLCEIAPARFCVAEGAAEATEVMGALVRQKRRRYQDTGAVDLLAKPHYLAFYSALAEKHSGTGLIHTSALFAGTAIVAAHCGMVFRNRFYWLMPSFEGGAWARFSPGRLLMQFLIEWSILRDLKKFDLTIGDDGYKHLWADHTLRLYDFIGGVTGRGKIYREIHLGSRRVRAWAKRMPWLVSLVRNWRSRASG
ncbi:MAG: GNAT family N-acetyltransferase [Beijerinckiaceae bacterium]|nr:GNAT family N-acetyltransferase [Beijerinckiaceae bacterium]